MANITELQLQGSSTVHKLNDARITTTAVDTATHILTTNSGVTSIAPITAANLASVLGAAYGDENHTNIDANTIKAFGFYYYGNAAHSQVHVPEDYGVLLCFKANVYLVQIFVSRTEKVFFRTGHATDGYTATWTQLMNN
jgi:hypothetical protein